MEANIQSLVLLKIVLNANFYFKITSPGLWIIPINFNLFNLSFWLYTSYPTINLKEHIETTIWWPCSQLHIHPISSPPASVDLLSMKSNLKSSQNPHGCGFILLIHSYFPQPINIYPDFQSRATPLFFRQTVLIPESIPLIIQFLHWRMLTLNLWRSFKTHFFLEVNYYGPLLVVFPWPSFYSMYNY